ncbi:MAG: c-type cytochrome domain-containing protein, partial [Planctomycetota bacterium]|nr:c-type cytochrome domain-containing protein [Planctomycetota bacterium]
MRKLSALFVPVLVLLFCSTGTLQAQKLTARENAFFEKSIRPLLAKHCYKCHSQKAGKSKGGLTLDTQAGWMDGGDSGPAIVSGSPEKSLLIKAIVYKDKDLEMPPKEKLSSSEIANLTRWVRMGAPDPRKGSKSDKPVARSSIDIAKGRQFWAFRKPASPAIPVTADRTWALGDIDRFILKSLEEKKLKPA